MNVSQLMSRSPVTCRPEDSLEDAASKMWSSDVGCLPVVNGEGHVVGMVTDRDACMAAYTQGRPLAGIRVDSAMAHEVHSCLPTDGIDDAADDLKAKKIRRMPVIDSEGRLVGVLAMNDLARESARQMGRKAPELGTDAVIATLAAISQPRRAASLTAAA